jgi:hypothetical protein
MGQSRNQIPGDTIYAFEIAAVGDGDSQIVQIAVAVID